MTPAQRETASQIICERVRRHHSFRAAHNIACYLPMTDEVDTTPLIARAWRANQRIFVPVLRARGRMQFREVRADSMLVRNSMSIWEPDAGTVIEPRALDVVVTPTVAFDAKRHRIGMGGGYYDRAFAFLRHRSSWLQPKLLGVAFACQRVDEIAPNPWDIPLYRVFCDAFRSNTLRNCHTTVTHFCEAGPKTRITLRLVFIGSSSASGASSCDVAIRKNECAHFRAKLVRLQLDKLSAITRRIVAF